MKESSFMKIGLVLLVIALFVVMLSFLVFGGATSFVVILLLIVIVINFIPSFIAFKRNHENKVAILILNICLGWTFIGWVVALVWAVKKAPL